MTADSTHAEDDEQRQVNAFLAPTIRKHLWVFIAYIRADAEAIQPS
jgi:hypothetical protein